MTVAFTLAGEPFPAPRPRVFNGKIVSNTQPYESAKELLAWAFKAKSKGRSYGDWKGPVQMQIDFHLGTARRRDLDNLQKTVLDALNGLAYHDDSQIDVLHVRKFVRSPDPRTQVVVLYDSQGGR